MSPNPLATAGLVMIGLSQVPQAWTALQPTPQETHFRVVQEFCKKQPQKSGDGRAGLCRLYDRIYPEQEAIRLRCL